MILKINEKEYKLCEKLTVEHFKHLLSFNIELQMNWRRLVEICFDLPSTESNYLTDKNIELAIVFIFDKISEVENDFNNPSFKNLENLTFGEYVDLEVYFSEGLHRNLEKVIDLLFSEKESVYIETYWNGIQNYLIWRINFLKRYKFLFESDDDDENEKVENEKEKTHKDVARSWYNILASVADDDILKMNQILNEPIIAVLNFLAYKKTKQLNELRRNNNPPRKFNA